VFRGRPATLRFAAALVLALVTFLTASVRPVAFFIAVSSARVLVGADPDAPMATERGGEPCRISGVRSVRDGRAKGARAGAPPLDPLRSSCVSWPARVALEELAFQSVARDAAASDRGRRHAELMVFLN